MHNRIELDLDSGKSITYGDEIIYGGVNFEWNINPDTDLTVGTVACSSITFYVKQSCDFKIGDVLNYSVKYNGASDWEHINIFEIAEITVEKNRKKIVAYDYANRLNAVVTLYWSSYSTTWTLNNLANYVCNLCNVNFNPSGLPINSSLQVNSKYFNISNITGRDVIRYIAQACGGYAVMNDSYVIIRPLKSSSISIDNSKYVSFEYANYEAPKITKVQVASDDDASTVPVESGDGDSVLRIVGNPCFMTDSSSKIQTYVDNIYNQVKNYSYTPGTLKLLDATDIRPGYIITVNDQKFLVMSMSINSSGVTLTCTGNQVRDTGTDVLSTLNALNGRYTKVKTDLGNISIELGNAEGDIAQINLDVEELSTKVTNAATNASTALSQSSTAITASAEAQNAASEAKQTAESFSTRITTAENNASEAVQTANSFSTRITDAEGNINSIEQTLTGVAFTSSLADGTTTINGGCITTGTIDASKASISNLTVTNAMISSLDANKISVAGKDIGSTSSSLNNLYSTGIYVNSAQIYETARINQITIATPTSGIYATMNANGITAGGNSISWADVVNGGGGSGGTAVFG